MEFSTGGAVPTSFVNLSRSEIYALLLNAPYFTVLELCQSSKSINAVCQEEEFWHAKFKEDFGLEERRKIVNISNKEAYKQLAEEIYKGLFMSPTEDNILPNRQAVEFVRNELPLDFFRTGSGTYAINADITIVLNPGGNNYNYSTRYRSTGSIEDYFVPRSPALSLQASLIQQGYLLKSGKNLLDWQFDWLRKQDAARAV